MFYNNLPSKYGSQTIASLNGLWQTDVCFEKHMFEIQIRDAPVKRLYLLLNKSCFMNIRRNVYFETIFSVMAVIFFA